MEPGFQEAPAVGTSQITELVREGHYSAEVPVTLIETGSEWSPYFSLEDAEKLDEVRLALRRGDLEFGCAPWDGLRVTPVAT